MLSFFKLPTPATGGTMDRSRSPRPVQFRRQARGCFSQQRLRSSRLQQQRGRSSKDDPAQQVS